MDIKEEVLCKVEIEDVDDEEMPVSPVNLPHPMAKKRRPLPDEIRRVIINESLKGISNTELSTIFQLPRSTVSSIISRFNKTGRLCLSKRGGDHRSLLTAEQKERVRIWMNEDASCTQAQLANRVLKDFGVKVSPSTILRCLKQFHFSIRQMNPTNFTPNVPKDVDERYEFATQFQAKIEAKGVENVYFLDEMGFKVSSKARACMESNRPNSVSHTRNITIIASMQVNGLHSFNLNYGVLNEAEFLTHLSSLKDIRSQTRTEEPLLILGSQHIMKYKGIHPLLNSTPFDVLSIPRNSPFLNPIRSVMSIWRNKVINSGVQNEGDLNALLQSEHSSLISESEAVSLIEKVKRGIKISMERLEIPDDLIEKVSLK